MDVAPLVRALLADVTAAGQGAPRPAVIARAVHEGIAGGMVEVARHARNRHGVHTVGLTGGVFQNRLLSDLARAALAAEGFTVLEHHRVPSNDGGLALGQALIAACADLTGTP